MSQSIQCPLCELPDAEVSNDTSLGFTHYYKCNHCGAWGIDTTAEEIFKEAIQNPITRAKIRNFVSKIVYKRRDSIRVIDESELESILQSSLPTIAEQIDALIYFLGHDQTLGKTLEIQADKLYRKIGAVNLGSAQTLIDDLTDKNIIDGSQTITNGVCKIKLTVRGWERFEELQQKKENKTAFMAMSFAEDLGDFYQAISAAVAETGFVLFRLDDDDAVRSGSIDDRLKVSIKVSRFLIADLTYQNQGVYWEAGYAEGKDKKVILTCREDYFNATHFDKNHDFVIKWTAETLPEKMKVLKAMIRNEFFDEVRQDNILNF